MNEYYEQDVKWPKSSPEEKAAESEEIAAQIKEYLAQGGKITTLPSCGHAEDVQKASWKSPAKRMRLSEKSNHSRHFNRNRQG